MENLSTKFLKKSFFTTILLAFVVSNTLAQQTFDTIATSIAGYQIPIKIKFPKKGKEKSPIYFFVHGGGWNGGDETKVPPANLHSDANFLVDELGVIYVGLAYRCKGNNATFADAINDLQASVKWFMDNAERFNADITRIGFGGASAGSTLAAMMAQKYKNCKLLVGLEGMYNLVDHDPEKSSFPDQKAREIYGLDTKKKSKKASPYYNLRKNPPNTLLLNGKEDALCHYSQTEKFANQIKLKGGKVTTILYDNINHTCLSPSYSEVMKKSVLEIAKLFIEEFQLKNTNIDNVETLLDQKLKGMQTKSKIDQKEIIGSWQFNDFILKFEENGKGSLLNSKNNTFKEFTYTIENETIICNSNNENKNYFLRQNNNIIYEINLENNALKDRRFNYRKLKS